MPLCLFSNLKFQILQAVCTENPGQVFLDATKAAQRISDNTKNKPEPAGVLLSPAPTFTPGTDAAILMPKVFPTGRLLIQILNSFWPLFLAII